MSNCVINLSPAKEQVFDEAWRVLKPGGRLAIADIVAAAPLPETVRNDPRLYAGCVAGASVVDELRIMLRQAGFEDIRIQPRDHGAGPHEVMSALIHAVKPSGVGGAERT